MLLTETGQVFSWGGGTRGQLGHGTLASEDKPRLIMALDGMKIKKVKLILGNEYLITKIKINLKVKYNSSLTSRGRLRIFLLRLPPEAGTVPLYRSITTSTCLVGTSRDNWRYQRI